MLYGALQISEINIQLKNIQAENIQTINLTSTGLIKIIGPNGTETCLWNDGNNSYLGTGNCSNFTKGIK